ncbi:protein of unknown function (plasmid) [Rhodovastum atsumiense]|nr:protein of unknown function [Rhodovastum atsumiense]
MARALIAIRQRRSEAFGRGAAVRSGGFGQWDGSVWVTMTVIGGGEDRGSVWRTGARKGETA